MIKKAIKLLELLDSRELDENKNVSVWYTPLSLEVFVYSADYSGVNHKSIIYESTAVEDADCLFSKMEQLIIDNTTKKA